MADLFIPVGGDPKFRLQYVDVSGGTADKFTPAMTPVDASGHKQVFSSGGIATFAIDQTTPGTTNLVEAKTQCRRNGGVLHRSAIAAADKLAVPSAPTVTDVATGGTLAQGTTYNCAIAAETALGPTTASSNGSVTTAGSGGSVHVAQVTIAQVANATAYDIFLSTSATPAWVARITETQRAAGVTITAVGTVSATSPGAGLVNVQLIGTGVASNAAPFTVNNAYVLTGITPIACAGYATVIWQVRLAVTDLRSAPSVSVLAFLQNQISGDYYQYTSAIGTGTFLTAVKLPLYQTNGTTTNGAPNMIILVDSISGQGAAVDVYVDLV